MHLVRTRRLARELVLQALYAHNFTQAAPEKVMEDLKRFNTVEQEAEKYALRLLNMAVKHQHWTKEEIARRLKNWDYERVALVDRLILQMMITEMVYMDDIPPKVSITEGVEIAKKFSTADSGAFINGILDSVYHSLNILTTAVT